ncbi:MAG: NAD(P)H-hydrate dehydratase [Anaerolineales bacterium]|nr:NAD(P)H-hydrate dehydratase [Anaerolineales bacterium]
MYIVTTQQMQAAEKAADASGLSYDQMMENAGRSIARCIERSFELEGARVLVLVGPGNNGGDGLVIARYLNQAGLPVAVYVWKRNTDPDPNWDRLDSTNVERILADAPSAPEALTQWLAEATIIVDALLGTGVSRPIEGSLAGLLDQTKAAVSTRRSKQSDTELIEPAWPAANPAHSPLVVAVDVPSGLNSDTGYVDPHTLSADLTVTLAAVKQGHILPPGPDVVGRLVVGDIQITPDCYPGDVTLEMATAAKVARMLPPRPVSAHKGTFGTALIVAGSIDYTGAAILCGQAALQAGAGLVTLAVPQIIHPIAAAAIREATYCPLRHNDGFVAPTAVQAVQKKSTKANALLIGPGLGHNDSTAIFLTDLLALPDSLPPLVLDADALNILAQEREWWRQLPPDSVLTPHPGEMARLMGTTTQDVQANRLAIATEMAAKWQQIVLLKGAHTIVAAPHGRTMVLPFANPALAKAGSGDVLAGTIVSLRAQGVPPFEAAVAGAYLHGLAGENVRRTVGATSATAGDLVACLPAATRELAAMIYGPG